LQFFINFSKRNEEKRTRTGRDHKLIVSNDEQNITNDVDDMPDDIDDVPDNIDAMSDIVGMCQLTGCVDLHATLLYNFGIYISPTK
jgi:hypothetical protein